MAASGVFSWRSYFTISLLEAEGNSLTRAADPLVSTLSIAFLPEFALRESDARLAALVDKTGGHVKNAAWLARLAADKSEPLYVRLTATHLLKDQARKAKREALELHERGCALALCELASDTKVPCAISIRGGPTLVGRRRAVALLVPLRSGFQQAPARQG
jgi:hypothetical protein